MPYLEATASDRLDVSQLRDATDAMRVELEAVIATAQTTADGKTDDAYAPSTPGNWDGGASAPTTISEALDRIAASIKANHGTGP